MALPEGVVSFPAETRRAAEREGGGCWIEEEEEEEETYMLPVASVVAKEKRKITNGERARGREREGF